MKRLPTLLIVLAAASLASGQSVSTTKVKGGVKGKWTSSIVMPRVSGSGSLAAFANADLKKQAASMLAAFKSEANETLKGGFKMAGLLEFDLQPTFTLVSSTWITGYWTTYAFYGGAHGMTGFVSFNYALIGGKARNARPTDLFSDPKSTFDDLDKILTQKLLANPNALFIKDGTSTVESDKLPFVVGKSSLLFLFEPYIAGPYSEGTFKVPVKYSEMLVKPKLRPN